MRNLFAAAVNAARSLEELCEVLNAESPTQGEATRADEHLMTDLPTFGGDEPASTHNVWSWDAERLIVQESAGFRIVPRAEWRS